MLGWECPKCGVCYAPFVRECETCGKQAGTITNHLYSSLCPICKNDIALCKGMHNLCKED